MKSSQFEKPILTVDVAYLSIDQEQIKVLAIKRPNPPFEQYLALPGGYVHCDTDRDLQSTATRIISEKTQLEPDYIEQVEAVASHNRDPRGWSATVLFLALIGTGKYQNMRLVEPCSWWSLEQLQKLPLAFDHNDLLNKVLERFISKSRYTSLPAFLLADTFTLTQAQKSFELASSAELEKKAFRRRLLDAGIIEETGDKTDTGKRKAALYRLKQKDSLYFFPRMIG